MNQVAKMRPLHPHALFLMFVTLLVFGEAFAFPFLNLDDTTFLVTNDYAHHWSSVPSFFTHSGANLAYKSANFLNYYRPINAIWVLLNYKLFGLHPALWHILALAMYLLGVWLLWRLTLHLTDDDFIALAAAILYALHPLHVEGVVWLSGATLETLLNVLFLGGFLSYLLWRASSRTIWLAICGCLTLLALLTKESAVALPVLIVLHALLFRSSGDPVSANRRLMALMLTTASVVIAYFLGRSLVIHGAIVGAAQHSWRDVFLTGPLLFVTQLTHAIWPVSLAPFYETKIVRVASMKLFYLPLTICIAFATLTVWALVRKPLAGFLLFWWTITLAPSIVGVLSFPDADVVLQDRFCFLALAGLCILLAGSLRLLPSTGQPLFGFPRTGVVTLAGLTAALGVLSSTQVYTWRNDISMCLHAIDVSPRSERPRMILAAEYIKRNDLNDALAVYRSVISMDPNQWGTYYAYGVTLLSAGNTTEAIPALARAIELAPTMSPPYLVLADVLYKQGKFEDAYRLLQQGIPVVREPYILRRQLAGIRAAQPHSRPQP